MIEVYAPASIGNFAVGFDALGAAVAPIDGTLLGDIVRVSRADKDEFECTGKYAHKLPQDAQSNLAYMCLVHFREHVAKDLGPLRLELEKNLPVGSGLGSSACSVVAAIAALNKYAGTNLSDDQLIELMADFESKVSGARHYDNIAPCYLGGLQLCAELIPDRSISLPFPDSWYVVVAYPGFALNTAAARKVLPSTMSLHHSIEFAQRLSGFSALMMAGQYDKAVPMIQDTVAEQYRAPLIAGFAEAKKAMQEMGAQAVSISGAGPTLFALCESEQKAQQCHQWLSEHYINEQGFSHVCQIDKRGTRQLNEETN